MSSFLITLVISTTSSINYRKLARSDKLDDALHSTYFFSSFLISLFVTMLSVIAVFIYSIKVGQIPSKLMLVFGFYSFSSALAFLIQDFLMSVRMTKIAIFLDLSLLIGQMLFFSFFSLINDLSIIVSVLVSFTLSYLFYSVSVVSIILTSSGISRPRFEDFKLLLSSENFLSVNAIHIIDRLDKLFIAFISPINNLAQFSTFSSMFTPIRSVFDSRGRLLYSEIENFSALTINSNIKRLKFYFFSAITLLIWAGVANLVIVFVLGREWVLGWQFTFLYILFELFRGVFIYKYNHAIVFSENSNHHRIAKLVLFICFLVIPLALYFGGILLMLCCLSLIYLIAIYSLRITR